MAGQEQTHTSGLSLKRRRIITVGILIGTFLGALEATVVSTAMPTVIASLGGLHIYSWVFSIYLLTSTVTVPIWGRLSDLYGRRVFYIAGIALFLLGSALSGQSQTMLELIIFRAIQGLGAGALVPLGLTIIGDLYAMVERTRVQTLFSAVWGVASILGPVTGGFLTDQLSWRWVFYINIPFGLAAAVIIGVALVEEGFRRKAAIDYPGAILLTASITLFLVALMEGGSGVLGSGGWSSWPVISMLAGSAGLLVSFVYVESRVPEPIVPLSLFSNAIFRAATVNGLLAGMALFGSISFIPLYVQGVMGGSATQAGSVLTPILLGWVTFAAIGGRLLLRVGYRSTVIAGMILLATGFFFLTRIRPSAGPIYIILDMLATGAGMGLSMLTLLIAVQSAVPRELLGIATSSTQFFRSIGGIVGVALMGSVLSSRLSSEVEKIVGSDGSHQELAELARHPDIIINAEARARIPAPVLQDFTTALDHALHSVFLVGLAVAILALFSAFLVPRGKSQEHARY